jgi:hypothetical protein
MSTKFDKLMITRQNFFNATKAQRVPKMKKVNGIETLVYILIQFTSLNCIRTPVPSRDVLMLF